MRVIHVLRKPLSEGTVAANTLRHGTGGLNIDASRITSHGDRANESGGGAGAGRYDDGVLSRTEERTYGGTLGGRVADPHPGGRWPANVILQHLDGCRCDGTKRVKGCAGRNSERRSHSKYRFQGEGTTRTDNHLGYADKDGKETVANWVCEPGCPVARLDEQSGVTKSTGGRTGNKDGGNIYGGGKGLAGAYSADDPGFGDTGGASRFYKQVGGSDE